MNTFDENSDLTVLSIAGSDPTAKAGIFLDMRTFRELEANGVAIITAVTSQNSSLLLETVAMSPKTINFQASSILSEYSIDGIKVGMLCNGNILDSVCDLISQLPGVPVVVDPVLRSTSGYDLFDPEAISLLIAKLFPLATVVTPNLDEAEILTNRSVTSLESMKEAARAICSMGARTAVIKGGHLPANDEAIDVLFDRYEFHIFAGQRKNAIVKRGKGCIFSSALTVNLARDIALTKAVEMAKGFVAQVKD